MQHSLPIMKAAGATAEGSPRVKYGGSSFNWVYPHVPGCVHPTTTINHRSLYIHHGGQRVSTLRNIEAPTTTRGLVVWWLPDSLHGMVLSRRLLTASAKLETSRVMMLTISPQRQKRTLMQFKRFLSEGCQPYLTTAATQKKKWEGGAATHR